MEYQIFKQQVGELCGIDLSNYKSQQMDRRLNSLMQAWDITSYEMYLEVLKNNPQKFKEFVNRLTINVSEFFRNPERFMELWEQVLPELLSKNRQITIWSAGCSDGSEPYSVAMVTKELNVMDRVKIIATDIDREIIRKAQEGCYVPNEIKSLPEQLRDKYFKLENNLFVLNNEIKKMVEFRHHNLLTDPYPANVDLIICRNVVIYFTDVAKATLYRRFFEALKPGGYLLVGGTEPILNYRQLGFEHTITAFYVKPAN